MLLAEELALVALKPGTGRFQLGMGSELNACLAGTLVGELLLDGHIRTLNEGGRVEPVPGRPAPVAPALAAALDVVAEKGPKLSKVLSHMNRGLEQRLGTSTRDTSLAGLAEAGVVEPSTGGLRARWTLIDHAARDSVLGRLRAAGTGNGPIEARTALVLCMSGPAHLLELVAPNRENRKHARKRIDHALDGTGLASVGRAVRKLLEEAASGAVVASSAG